MNKAQKNILLVLTICSFLIGLDALIVAPLIPEITKTTKFSIELGGLLVTAYALLYGLSAPFFGPLSDRWGRKKVMLIGMIIFSFGTILTAFSGTLTELLIYRAISGIGGAMVMPSAYAMIGDHFSYEQRGKVMGILLSAMSGSTILGVPLGSLLAELSSWKIAFILLGLFSLCNTALLYLYIPEQNDQQIDDKINPLKRYVKIFGVAFSNPSVFFALLCTLFWWAGFQGMFANMGIYYHKYFSLSTQTIGLIFAFSGLGSFLGNIIGGRISDKIGKKPIILIACLLSGTGILLLPLLKDVLFFAVAVHVVWAIATGMGQSSLTTFMSELNPSIRGTVLSLNSSATYLGMTAATSISVILLKNSSFGWVAVTCALFIFLVLPIMGIVVKENNVSVQTKVS